MNRYTSARFAQSAARIASWSAAWAGDIGDNAQPLDDANPDSVRRYLADMRLRLSTIEEWEAENRQTETGKDSQ